MTQPLAGQLVKGSDHPHELAYSEITTGTSEITTLADVGVSVTFTLTETRIVRLIGSFLCRSTNAGDTFRTQIADSANVQQMDGGTIAIAGATFNHRREFSRRLSLAAGTYTYKLRAECLTSAGTTIISASTTNPTYLHALDLGRA